MKSIKVTTEVTTHGTAFQFDEAEATKLADKELKDFKEDLASIEIIEIKVSGTRIHVFKEKDYIFYLEGVYNKNGYKIKDKDWIVNINLSTSIHSPEEFKEKFKVIE